MGGRLHSVKSKTMDRIFAIIAYTPYTRLLEAGSHTLGLSRPYVSFSRHRKQAAHQAITVRG